MSKKAENLDDALLSKVNFIDSEAGENPPKTDQIKGRPKGSRAKVSIPEAVGTFVSGNVLGAVLKLQAGTYLMVIPNPDFPSCVEMDLQTAALRLNLCDTRIFDQTLSKKMSELKKSQSSLFQLPLNPESAL
jgi:hypothetical protein